MAKPICLLIIWAIVVFGVAVAASSDRIGRDRECWNKARWAGQVFDIVTENPKVILSGADAEDANAFAFIRDWVKQGKTREDLVIWTLSRCMGTEV